MKNAAIWKMICLAYKLILRDLLKKAIDDPNEEWDDFTLAFLDKLFDYSA